MTKFFVGDENLVWRKNFPTKISSDIVLSDKVCAYQEVRNVSFPETFTYLLNEWCPTLFVAILHCVNEQKSLTLSWRGPLLYRNQSTDLQSKWTGFYMITASVISFKKCYYFHLNFCCFFILIWNRNHVLFLFRISWNNNDTKTQWYEPIHNLEVT